MFPTKMTELPAADASHASCPRATHMRLDTTADGAHDSPSELRDGGFPQVARLTGRCVACSAKPVGRKVSIAFR